MNHSAPLFVLLLAATIAGGATRVQGEEPACDFLPLPDSPIANVIRLDDSLYSGAGPSGDADFDFLKSLGVRTIVSVDGAAPLLESAKTRGMAYVHIPLQYRGVPEAAARALTEVMRTCPRPIYMHCHHGKHRGPAAAAVCGLAGGLLTSEQSLQFLKAAGTGDQYAGLWRDVKSFAPLTAEELARQPRVELPESVPPGTLTDAMIRIDALTAEVRAHLDENRTPAAPREEATQLAEEFREAARLLAEDAGLQTELRQSAETATELAAAASRQSAVSLFSELQTQCNACHVSRRDR